MKVLITNTVALNTGDAAILRAAVLILRRSFPEDLDITAYDSMPEAAAHHYPDIRFRPALQGLLDDPCVSSRKRGMRVARALFALPIRGTALGRWLMRGLPPAFRAAVADHAAADLVLATGGTGRVPGYAVFPRVFDFLVAILLGRPLMLFTQSLGPFPRGKLRPLLRFALRRARLILVRDRQSRLHLEDLGVRPSRIAVAADAAFALAQPAARGPAHPVRPLQVAISVRDWPEFRNVPAGKGMGRYIDVMAVFAEGLVQRQGADVTFLSTCQGIPEHWTDDSRVAEEVAARLPPSLQPHVAVDRRFYAPERLLERLAQFDIAVAARMHAAILALCAGVLVLPIACKFETTELFDALGLGTLTQDVETLSVAGLDEAFSRLVADKDGIAARLRPKVDEMRRSAFAAGEMVREALERAA